MPALLFFSPPSSLSHTLPSPPLPSKPLLYSSLLPSPLLHRRLSCKFLIPPPPPSSSRSSRFPILCKIPNITQDSFPHEVLQSDLPVLVGFCADWCGPCRLIGPIMDSVAEEFNGSLKVVKVDTESSPDLVEEYDVYGLPTLILFKDGTEVPKSRREGTITATKLKDLLNELLATAATT